jgi:hypothetical protein
LSDPGAIMNISKIHEVSCLTMSAGA